MNIRQRFTKWYVRKGYWMEYEDGGAELIFTCPRWVRLLAGFFFSPSVYYKELEIVYV